MHNNYYFLRQLSQSLEKILKGCVISECFSQEKDELIVRFETSGGSFFIKASTHPELGCLSFSNDFQRARRNSVDLFGELIGQRVLGIRQFTNERSFALNLSNAFDLVFKMHGNRANIILCKNGHATALFRKSLVADLSIRMDSLDREIDWSYEAFLRHSKDSAALYFTFGKRVWQHLEALGFREKTVEQKWKMIGDVLTELNAGHFYLARIAHMPVLSLIRSGKIEQEWTNPIVASNNFYYAFTQALTSVREKASALSLINNRLNGSLNYREKNQQKLQELLKDDHYKMWGDLLMANLHAIPPGTTVTTVADFYHDNVPVDIKLKKELTPQKNAEVYYRKSKNRQQEITRLRESLEQKEREIALLNTRKQELEETEDLKKIRSIRKELNGEAAAKPGESLPYHEFVVNGFRIWVGRNAQANDTLTFKLGYKEDLWLHAKDVAGSHVLVKYQAGKTFPKDVVEQAAQLAAYNSKRKTDTLCPVAVTPRKFVRKRKGDPPGAVIVEREDVIMVEPRLIG